MMFGGISVFSAPVFADQEKSAHSRILHLVICGTVFVAVSLLALIMIFEPATVSRAASAAAFILSMGLILLQINRRGRTRSAAMLFAGGLIATITVLAVTAGGVHSPGVTMYFVIVFMTGLLLGERPGAIAALVCIALGLGLLMAERADLLPEGIRYSSTTIWLLSCLYMGVTIVLLRLPSMLTKAAVLHMESELTERERLQESLLENQRLLQTLIENTPAAVAMFDTEMRYIAYSKRWLTDYRLGDRDLIGLSHYEVFPETGEERRARHRRCLAGATEVCERDPFMRGDGTVDIVRWEMQPWIKGSGGIGGITMFTEVITDRVRAEEERSLLRDQLLEAQKFEALGTLAGGIAHDFNNIIAMIGTNAELARAEASNELSVRASLSEILSATIRAKDVVRQILLFSRKQETAFATESLFPIIDSALSFLSAALPANVEIRITVEPSIPPVRANASQIYQVLMNLGTNAAYAMSAGGVLSVGVELVDSTNVKGARPGDLRTGKYVHMSVQDTGAGMSGETLNRIFEPFFTTKGPEGTGLGMSVVHGIVKAHSGTISVESELGRGSTVHVYLPAMLGNPAGVPQDGEQAVRGNGQHIMYIDDERALGSAMERILVLLGYRCTIYTDPQVALDALRGNPGRFDAIISDVIMPMLSGIDVAREIGAISPSIPVALTSGRIDQDMETLVDRKNVKAWLSKPATLEEIGSALAIMLQNNAE
jgi:PAS domain S-box-containing protein